jgi:hypothetical protein
MTTDTPLWFTTDEATMLKLGVCVCVATVRPRNFLTRMLTNLKQVRERTGALGWLLARSCRELVGGVGGVGDERHDSGERGY